MYVCMYVCMYIYICMYVYVCMLYVCVCASCWLFIIKGRYMYVNGIKLDDINCNYNYICNYNLNQNIPIVKQVAAKS